MLLRRWFDESEQLIENVDQTYLVLACLYLKKLDTDDVQGEVTRSFGFSTNSLLYCA